MLNRPPLLSRHIESQRSNVKLITGPRFLELGAYKLYSLSQAKALPTIKDENGFSVMKTLVTVQFLQILRSIGV